LALFRVGKAMQKTAPRRDFMRIKDANSRRGAPRLLGLLAAAVGTLVIALVAYSGSAAAIVGPTDLSITKSDSPDPVVQGNNLTYTIQVQNHGPNDASAVSISDNLPSQVDYQSSSTTAGTCQRTGSTVNCTLGPVTNGVTVTVTIVVKAKHTGAISNTAALTSVDDNTPNNNSATATTQVVKTGKKGKAKATCASPTIRGTPGDDVINGTSAGDVIVTYEGNDQVFSGGGKDLVCTGAGADLVLGGPGGDTVIGGGGADTLKGNGGGDLLKGKNGRDRLRGQAGNDTLNGGKKRDSCKGGAGSDTLIKCP
jgi:uncharacterized repeat protein (TIGR01451 family)